MNDADGWKKVALFMAEQTEKFASKLATAVREYVNKGTSLKSVMEGEKRGRKRKNKDPSKKRAPTDYNLWMRWKISTLKADEETQSKGNPNYEKSAHKLVFKEAAEAWKQLSEREKEEQMQKARKFTEEHDHEIEMHTVGHERDEEVSTHGAGDDDDEDDEPTPEPVKKKPKQGAAVLGPVKAAKKADAHGDAMHVQKKKKKHKHDNEGVTPTKKHKKKHHAGDES